MTTALHKKNVIFWLKILTATLIISIVVGCSGNQEKDKNLKFGFIGPLTGPAASYGNAQMNGVKLAVEEINSAGGIDGMSIEVIFEDSQMDPNKAISAIKKLINIDKVASVIGATTTAGTLAIAHTANTNKIVLLSPSASGAKVTAAGDYVFRASPSDSFQAVVAAKYVYQLGFKKGAIVYTNDEWGSGLQNAFENSFKNLGGEILTSEGLTPGTQDFRTQLVKLKTLHPEFIFIPLYPDESPTFLRQVKELEVPAQIVGADNFSESAILETAGTTANGVIFAIPAESQGKEYSTYLEHYKAKYNEDGNYASAAAYDCVYLLVNAIKKSGVGGENIKNALYQVKDFHGASGTIGFDENGDVTTKQFSINKIADGKYSPIN